MTLNPQEMLNDYINEMVDNKIIALSKSPLVKIDKQAIRKECENAVFSELSEQMTKELQNLTQFTSLLKDDDPQLFKDLTETIEKIDKHETFAPPDKPVLERLQEIGTQWYEKNEWAKAESYFVFLAKTDPENPQVWLLRGMAEHNLQEYPNALASYAYALMLAPQYAYAHVQLIKCLIAMKEMDSAKERYELFMNEFNSNEKNDFIGSQIENLKEFLFIKAA